MPLSIISSSTWSAIRAVTMMWVRMLCRNNREAMDKIVEVLIEKETIDGKEFRALLSECASELCC